MNKKIITTALLLTPTLIALQGVTVEAMSKAVIQESNPITTNSTNTVTVTATKGSTFSVVIPKTIELDDTGSSEYRVVLKGNIAADETLTVVPDGSFTLSQEGKDDLTGTITQTDTSATYNEITPTTGKTISGSVNVPDITAGNWSGTFNFKINLN